MAVKFSRTIHHTDHNIYCLINSKFNPRPLQLTDFCFYTRGNCENKRTICKTNGQSGELEAGLLKIKSLLLKNWMSNNFLSDFAGKLISMRINHYYLTEFQIHISDRPSAASDPNTLFRWMLDLKGQKVLNINSCLKYENPYIHKATWIPARTLSGGQFTYHWLLSWHWA